MKNELMFALMFAVAGAGVQLYAHEGHGAHDEAAEAGKTVSLTGEVVDMACYMGHEGKGKKHADCAKMCAVGGVPIGLLVDGKTLYLLVEDHDDKKPYDEAKKKAGETATVKGKLVKRGGLSALIVQAEKTK